MNIKKDENCIVWFKLKKKPFELILYDWKISRTVVKDYSINDLIG